MLLRSFIFVILICFFGCQNKNQKWQLSSDEYRALQRVFQYVMLEEGGIYTLCGDKPITCFTIGENPKANGIPMSHLSLKDWNTYEQVGKRYNSNRFLFVKIPHPVPVPGVGPFEDGYFVNIPETATVLQEHYSLFRERVGFDFDPMVQVYDIQNPSSVFWNKTLKNKFLLGILLGFGKKNAYLFEEWAKATKQQGDLAGKISALSTGFSDTLSTNRTIRELSLPIFRTFPTEENEQFLEKYRKQKQKIEEIYRGHDFVEMTLENLVSNHP